MTSKLSFSIPLSKSKSKSKPKPSSEDKQLATNSSEPNLNRNNGRQYVTEFDSTKTLTHPNKSKSVIPPIQNAWRPIKRMKNLQLPITDSENNSEDLRFVVESLPTAGDGNGDNNMSYGLNLREKSATGEDGTGIEKLLLDKLRYDLKQLPEDRGFEEFEDMPVEEFGAALLAGYGWKEGQGIGRNAKEDVKVKQYEKRDGKLGLGFIPDKSNAVANNNNNTDRDKNNNAVANNNNNNNNTDRDKKKDERSSDRRDEKGISNKKDSSRWENGIGKSEKRNSGRRIAWLRRQIKVRIVSKKLKRGKFYLKKGVVVDVVEPHVCDISMDDGGELVQGVDQDLLETALPRKGGPVVVLFDKHKGVRGNLVRRDLDRGVGVVEDRETLELLNVNLDQIAEYVGDAGYN